MFQRRIGLRTLLIIVLGVLAAAPALISGLTYTGTLRSEAERSAANALQARGTLATNLLARRLHAVWYSVFRFAGEIDQQNSDELRQTFSLLPRIDERITWVGFADVAGVLKVASNGQGEGTNVAKAHWFYHGLLGPYAEAENDEEDDASSREFDKATKERRIIDFSVPVKNAAGEVIGVLGAHIAWDWVREQISSLGNDITDVLLIARDRHVLAGPEYLQDKILNTPAAVAASQVASLNRMETWPNGKSYLTVVLPAVQYRNLPNFGWSLILRRDVASVLAPTQGLIQQFWKSLALEIVVSLVLIVVLAFWVTTPLHRIAKYATALAQGEEEGAPHEETRYREAAMLSASLVQIQSQMLSPPVLPLLPREPSTLREPSAPREPSSSQELVVSLSKLRSAG